MIAYLHLLGSITVPIVIICACGTLLQRFRPVDTKLLADISLYILAPALILSALAESHLGGADFLSICLFTVVMTALLWLLALGSGKLLRLPEKKSRALTLTTLFSNANNYGLPVLLLAFGRTGFALGAVYVVGQIALVNILGMYLAARAQLSARQALSHLLKTPLIYACAAGLLMNGLQLRIPAGGATALHMLGNAYPVLVLLILGIKLGQTGRTGVARPEVWIGIALRIACVPLIAKAVLIVLGVHGLLASVLFIEISMPAAINTVMLTEKFSGDTEMVSLIVTMTTLLSFLYLPLLIAIG
ncbi:MAG: AEC family transporter [Sporolactobacillus sp.]|jgi:predicted permease|nr:AEC family transporter [Sporolactobacillus sp.]